MEWPWARLHALTQRMSAFENTLNGVIVERVRGVLRRYDRRMDGLESRIAALERVIDRERRRRDAA